MKKIGIPWAAWYKDIIFELSFPESWEVQVYSMQDKQDIGEQEIKKALQNPVGTAKISQLARNKNSVAIAVDDLSRPTPVFRMLPYVIQELNKGGIKKKNIHIIMALGAHRPMNGQDLVKKLGQKVVDTIDVCNHNPYENLTYLGVSARGTPIYINRFFMQADLKIGIGGVIPHVGAGFGGGGKIVAPGLAGIETIEKNHEPVCREETNKTGQIENNENRVDIEEIARKVGLNFIINVVVNSHRGIAALVAGDLIKAHRQAVREARKVYSTPVPQNIDVGLFNAYPKDTDGRVINAFHLYLCCGKKIVRENGVIIVSSACSEGSQDIHFLEGFGMRLFSKFDDFPFLNQVLRKRKLVLFSPNFSQSDLRKNFSKRVVFFRQWEKVIKELNKDFKRNCRVALFPSASIQLGVQ